MPVISNTSPIWNLASIQRLQLLHEQFPEVLIPPEVLAELQLESGFPETAAIQNALNEHWIQVKPLKTSYVKRTLMLEMEKLRMDAGFFISESLFQKIILNAGE